MKKITVSLALFLLASSMHAQNNPTSMPTDNRMKRVVFQENNVVPIQGMTFTTTQIQFGERERIMDIEGGDTAAWMVTYHPELPNIVFIKPTLFNSSTNMTIITNLHTYYFHLTSNKKLDKNPTQQTYALKFVYPVVIRHKKSAKSTPAVVSQPKIGNTAYRFSGSPR
jgi:type IV secretion system protein VirB9